MKTIKKLLCTILSLVTLLIAQTTVLGHDLLSYSDVPQSHWAYDAIETASEKNWFRGYPDGTFVPSASITRAEAVKVFVEFLGLEMETLSQVTFSDVSPDSWYAPYVAVGKDLLPMHGNGVFQPDIPITREDTIYALVKALKCDGSEKNIDFSTIDSFTDKSNISDNIKTFIAVGLNHNLISGYPDGTLKAQGSLTRAEFATLLMRGFEHGFHSKNAYSNTLTPITTTKPDGESVNQCSFSDLKANLDIDIDAGYGELSLSFDYICNVDIVRCGVEMWKKKNPKGSDGLEYDIIKKAGEPGKFNEAMGYISSDGDADILEVGETYEWVGYVYDRRGNIYKSDIQEYVFTDEESRFLQIEKESEVEEEDSSERCNDRSLFLY